MEHKKRNFKEISISKVYPEGNTDFSSTSDAISDFTFEFGNPDSYQLTCPIGYGQYGYVFLGKINHTNEIKAHFRRTKRKKVAIKILKGIGFSKIKKEILIIKYLQDIPNILKMYDVIKDDKSQTISLITEYEAPIKGKQLYPLLTIDEIRHLMFNLLFSLNLVHKKGVIHRDIKPGNLVVRKDRKNLIIIDWGLADFYFPKHHYTTRVSTLRYKPPELLLEYPYYDFGIDVWGAGIVFGEMLIRYPFFQGRDDDGMILDVAALCGSEQITKYAKRYGLEIPETISAQVSKRTPETWNKLSKLLPPHRGDGDAIDLLKRLLIVDHAERISAKEALQHPFFNSIRSEYERKYAEYW